MKLGFGLELLTRRRKRRGRKRRMRRYRFPSVLSKRYGTLSSDEASAAAHQIKGKAFSAAGASAATSADGIETLHE
ncbi:hypothetical protein DEO72_LG9g146 [Vigna unguiculata]|uniref:WPP domain-containing protein n=1 Tax=Vigna unguiculata TaxID=3917 RepID=A0A4D6MUJ5_VIGUN|nr:hypothetical protein DEO72_LG9g146 [Vigna unguiculata]